MKSPSWPGGRLLALVLLLRFAASTCHRLSSTASASSASSSSSRTRLGASLEAAGRFWCREPQQRAYNLPDLMRAVNPNPSESATRPFYVVLNRCDGRAGCCAGPSFSCAPVRAAVYYQEFEIELWSLDNNETRREWIRVEQHGRCDCKLTTLADRLGIDASVPNVTRVRT